MVGRERDGCLLSDPKARCEYFEQVVAPVAEYWPGKYGSAARSYRRRIPRDQDPPLSVMNNWTCDCGRLMPRGRRMCDACARKNRRESNRRAQAKRRNTPVSS